MDYSPHASRIYNETGAAPAPRAGPPGPARRQMKRIIVCCDGTWMNSLGDKGDEPPSNVTRISRVIRRNCLDGTHQIVLYNPGVGSSGSKLDSFTGGAFGMGLDRDIRIAYNFICNNYVDGDNIILIGFSRGAFTARSVADLIAGLGLLNEKGLERFSAIFHDYKHLENGERDADDYLFKDLTPFRGETGLARSKVEERRKAEYRRWLRDDMRWTRTNVTITALAVWDTVGSLGIPPAPVFGIRGSASQWKFTNTQISNKVENAFQALALDEPRFAFRPALWERVGKYRTNLKQVWFPGNHGNVGGGWHDQQISDITLAWMCDQLSTVGVEFNLGRMKAVFAKSMAYSAAHPYPFVPKRGALRPWAKRPVCRGIRRGQQADDVDCPGTHNESGHRHPPGLVDGDTEHLWDTARSWSLGQIRHPESRLQLLAGTTVRHPGLFRRADEQTNKDTEYLLENTNERVHSSVRVRLACRGLGLDDKGPWDCPGLTEAPGGGPLWKLENRIGLADEELAHLGRFRPNELRYRGSEFEEERIYRLEDGDGRWRWVFRGDEADQPHDLVLPEEPVVGFWERLLLWMSVGDVDVWRYAEENPPAWVMDQPPERPKRRSHRSSTRQ